jgi:hypothetical protein
MIAVLIESIVKTSQCVPARIRMDDTTYFLGNRPMEDLDTLPVGTLPEFKTELEEPVSRLVHGTRDPETMRKACERMDRMREEMRQRVGEVEFAVGLIRESRDQA